MNQMHVILGKYLASSLVDRVYIWLLLAASAFGFLLPTNLLLAILHFLLSPPACTFLVCHHSCSPLSVLWLELLHLVEAAVDKTKATAATTTKGSMESEELNAIVVMHLE